MDRLDDLKKIIQLYEMHAVVDRGRDSENVQAPLSSFLEVAVRGSVSARRNEAVLARMSKLCERKVGYMNDLTWSLESIKVLLVSAGVHERSFERDQRALIDLPATGQSCQSRPCSFKEDA